MLKKIICTHGGGRFGNQLINYIHLVALGLEHPSLKIEQWELNKYLSLTDGKFIVSNGKLSKLNRVRPLSILNNWTFVATSKIKILISRVKITLNHLYFHLHPKSHSAIIGESGGNIGFLPGKHHRQIILDEIFLNSADEVVCLAGWEFRNWDLVNKWKNEITSHLKHILLKREESPNIGKLGVHIRGNDFKTYQGGTLYLSDKEWHLAIKRFERQHNSEVKSHIYMSDENKDWKQFTEQYVNSTISTGSVGGEGDLFDGFADLLSCQWIITTGSTFALMASWIGDIETYSANDLIEKNKTHPVNTDDWSKHDYFKYNWI